MSGRRPVDTFGARLALMRQAMGGWNVKQTANTCGINDQSWRNWEAGALPHEYMRVCHQIAEGLGFELDWVVKGGALLPPSTKWYKSPAAVAA